LEEQQQQQQQQAVAETGGYDGSTFTAVL